MKRKKSPTARTMALLRKEGCEVAIVERKIPHCFISKDLFGMFDLLAIHPSLKGCLGIQCTSAANHAARVKKLLASPILPRWLQAGNGAEVISWRKSAEGKWTARRESISPTAISNAPPSNGWKVKRDASCLPSTQEPELDAAPESASMETARTSADGEIVDPGANGAMIFPPSLSVPEAPCAPSSAPSSAPSTIAILPSELWRVDQADAMEWLQTLPADSADLLFASPPYEAARSYGIDFNLRGQEWVDWMARIVKESLRVCRGLVAFVVQGQTRNFRWSAVPACLMADLHRAGLHLRNPPIFHRIGIPGSGGPDWLRSDYEWIVCATRGGKLPWSDNTAMGQPPKWNPGGTPSHRQADGSRVNAVRLRTGPDEGERQLYTPPKLANPGNIIHCKVGGGGLMGNKLCHENEAPFPEALAEFFVRSFCPPDGLVLDCFCGSGTTGAVALRHGRRFAGCDVRLSQVELSRRRIGEALASLKAS